MRPPPAHAIAWAAPPQWLRRCLLALLTLLALVSAAWAAPAQELLFVGVLDPQQTPQAAFLVKVYTEALRRLGYRFKYATVPGLRARLMVQAGTADGELMRTADYIQINPSARQLGEAIGRIRLAAYATKDSPITTLDGWESLRHSGYTVNYRRGVSHIEQALSAVLPPAQLGAVDEPSSGISKLIRGRCDLFIASETTVAEVLAAHPELAAIKQVGVMEAVPTYAFLSAKHAALAPKLDEVLKRMKREGLVAHYAAHAQRADQAAALP